MKANNRRALRAAGALAAILLAGRAAAEGDLARAREAAALGSADRALAIALDGLKTAPADKDLFLYAVEMLPEKASPQADALAAAAAARLEKKDEHYAWYLGICKVMRVSAKAPEALSNCKKALELEPTAYPVYRELGLTYAAAGNPRKAAETLEQGVEISSSDYKARYNLARVLETRGDASRAKAAYTKGLILARRDNGMDAQYYRALLTAGLKRTARQKPPAPPRKQAVPKKAASPEQAAACLAKFREEFLKDNLGSALEQSEACVKLSPAGAELAAERAPLLVRLGRYEDGANEYERAAALYGPKDPMSAFCRTKASGTWLKLGDKRKALLQSRLALASSPQDLNALKGLAEVQEARSDNAGALEAYEAILKLDPGNAKAGTRREELKTALLSGDQILSELHLRQAVDEQKISLSPEDAKLFKAIKAAELGGAVDYLKAKVPTAKGVTMERKTPDGTKLLLTGAGYKAYVYHATKDAVKLFEEKGIGLREIFQLRDLAGNPVFDASGKLTQEGEEVWRTGSGTKKIWLLPYEPIAESPKAKEAKAQIASLEGQGYQEISEPEYLWLLKVTRCPEPTLQGEPVSAVKQLDDGTRPRYLLCYDEKGTCKNMCNSKLALYIASYRENNTSEIESDYSTGFFGRGAVKKRRFCENGEVWLGDVGMSHDKNPCKTPEPSAR